MVRVRDFNGDTSLKMRFTYDVELTVLNAGGKPLAVHQAKGERDLDPKGLDSSESLQQRQIPIYYGQIIRELVRGDPLIILALGNDSA